MNSDSGEEVLGALTLACSQDPSLLKVGEGQLEAWKREKGFYTTLAVSSTAGSQCNTFDLCGLI